MYMCRLLTITVIGSADSFLLLFLGFDSETPNKEFSHLTARNYNYALIAVAAYDTQATKGSQSLYFGGSCTSSVYMVVFSLITRHRVINHFISAALPVSSLVLSFSLSLFPRG